MSKHKYPIKIWSTCLNRKFSIREIQMINKHLKKHSTSLGIKKGEIKTNLRFHPTHEKNLRSIAQGKAHAEEDVE